jgi:RecA DNA recombination protein
MRSAVSKAEIESEIASRFGTAFKLREKPPAEVISTGISEIDSLSGGLPRGAITEIYGPASSGRTSLVLSTLAFATTHEEVCALVDTNDVLDLTSAAQAGIDFEQLLWIRCAGNLEHAFKATDLLLQAGGFGLVALDIGDVPAKHARRIISSWWYRFRRVVEDTPTILVLIAQGPCVHSCASLILEMKNEVKVWLLTGSAYALHESQDSFSVLSPFTNHSRPAIYQPYKNPNSPPNHSNLLRGMQLRVKRQRPIHLGEREVQFGVTLFGAGCQVSGVGLEPGI